MAAERVHRPTESMACTRRLDDGRHVVATLLEKSNYHVRRVEMEGDAVNAASMRYGHAFELITGARIYS